MSDHPNGEFFPALRPASLDRFVLRRRLRTSFQTAFERFDLTSVLDVGSGQQPWRQFIEPAGGRYVAIDIDTYPGSPAPDVRWDGQRLPVRDGWATTVLLTEVLEHSATPGTILTEIARVLAPGGTLYLTVPFLWPVHDAPYDEHRYTPFAIARLLRDAGLEQEEIWTVGGWDASLAVMLGLWSRRRPMGRISRAAVSTITLPLIWALDRRDRPGPPFQNGMTVGVAALARRAAAT